MQHVMSLSSLCSACLCLAACMGVMPAGNAQTQTISAAGRDCDRMELLARVPGSRP